MYSRNKNNNYKTNTEVGQAIVDYLTQKYVQAQKEYSYSSSYNNHQRFLEKVTSQLHDGKFEANWSLGGTYGHYSGSISTASPEPEQQLDDLDEFLMQSFPNINFLQYKMIEKKIQRTTENEGDYYGGSVTRAYRILTFTDLSDGMINAKVVIPGFYSTVSELEDYLKEKYNKEWFKETFPEVEVTQTKPKNKKK